MAVLRQDVAVVAGLVPVVELLHAVQAGKHIRDPDRHRAAVHAVAAAGAGDQVHAAEDLPDPRDGGQLRFAQRGGAGHEADVLLHLLQAAHAGEDHHHVFKPGGKAQGQLCGADPEPVDLGRGGFGEICQSAALDRLHDDDGLAVLHAGLIDPAGVHRVVLVIQIVELDLDELDLRIGRQDAVQNLRGVVEGEADVADLSLGLELEGGLVGPAGLEVLEVAGVLGVHQVEVEIFRAAGLELPLEQGTDLGLGLKEDVGQFVREQIAVSGIAGGQALAEGGLAFAAVVAVGRVEVVEAGLEEGIRHPANLGGVDLLAVHREAHAAEAEFAADLGEEWVGHVRASLFLNISVRVSCRGGQRRPSEAAAYCGRPLPPLRRAAPAAGGQPAVGTWEAVSMRYRPSSV